MSVRYLFLFCVCVVIGVGSLVPTSLFSKTLDHVDGTYITFSYPDNNKFGRIWIAPTAKKGASLPLVVFYHGAISSVVGNDEDLESVAAAYIGPKAKRRFDHIANDQIRLGKVPPLIIASPIEGTNSNTRSFTRDSDFSFDGLVQDITAKVQAAGYGIDTSNIILAGHSNGGVGFYDTILDNSRQTAIKAGALLDTGMSRPRPKHVEERALQKPAAFVGFGASNFPQGAGAWFAGIKEVFNNDNESPIVPCESSVFAYCKKFAERDFYYYQVDTRTVNDSHNEAVNLFFTYGLPLLFQGAVTANDEAFFDINELHENLRTPTPQIDIPGLSFSDVLKDNVQQEGGQVFIYIPFLGEYIAAIYRYGVAALVLLCIIMIMVSGAQLMFSGLSADMATAAKKRIGQALIGLFLGLGSYSLLAFINPQLVEFKHLKILYNQTAGAVVQSSPKDPKIGAAGSKIVCDKHKYATQQNVFAVGDSITVGIGTKGQNTAYGERLIAACPQLGKYDKIALGGKGTKKMLDALTPRNLRVEGFSHIIILAGVNDIGSERSTLTVTKNLETMYKKAKADGLRVIAVTISPFGKREKIWTQEKELRRKAVNEWIYKQQQTDLVDIVIDFDKLIRDPNEPHKIAPQYDRDGIHPNDAAHDLLAGEIARKAFQ